MQKNFFLSKWQRPGREIREPKNKIGVALLGFLINPVENKLNQIKN